MTAKERDRAELGGAVRGGVAVTGGTYAFRQAAEVAISIVLARLLVPADFGPVAVIGTFLQLSYVVGNLGMGGAVVQAASLDENDRRAAFTISAAIGLGLTLVSALLALWLPGWFHMPVLRLAMPVMSLQIFLAGLSAVPTAMLRRSLRFGPLAVVDGGTTFVYGVTGIGLAVAGYGVWSLVWAPVVAAVWTLGSVMLLSREPLRLGFTRGSARRLLGFGSALTLKNVFVHLGRNGDNLVVARALGDAATGLYTRAFNFSTMPQTRFVSLLYGVCFPVFCRVKDDHAELRGWYLKGSAAVAVVVTPILFGLCTVAREFTVAVLGEQWLGMVPAFRILCLAGLVNCLHTLGGAAIEASGRLRYEIATESFYALAIPLGALLGVRSGIEGVSIAVLCAASVMYLMKAFTLRQAIGLPVRDYVGAVAPPLVAGIVMAAVAVLAVQSSAAMGTWGQLGAAVFSGALAYAVALSLVGRRHVELVVRQVQRTLEPWRAGMRRQAANA